MIALRDNEKELIQSRKAALEKNNIKQFFNNFPSNCGNIAPMLIGSGFDLFRYIDRVMPNMFNGSTIDTFDIPEGPISIDKQAFYGCESLKSITIPDTVRQIGQEAFEGCTSLRDVFIPDSVVNIQSHAFPHLDNIMLSTPRRGGRNKLYLPKQDIEWYKHHLVFIDEKEGE